MQHTKLQLLIMSSVVTAMVLMASCDKETADPHASDLETLSDDDDDDDDDSKEEESSSDKDDASNSSSKEDDGDDEGEELP